MKLNSKVIVSFALLALSISCSQQVEKNKLRGQYEAYDPKSGDAQGAVVQLAGVVTELEDVDNKEKKVGLSVSSDEVDRTKLTIKRPSLREISFRLRQS